MKTLPAKIFSFGAAILTALTLALRGRSPVASREVQQARLTRCRRCPSFADPTCRACGCHTAVKAAFASESCPHHLWP